MHFLCGYPQSLWAAQREKKKWIELDLLLTYFFINNQDSPMLLFWSKCQPSSIYSRRWIMVGAALRKAWGICICANSLLWTLAALMLRYVTNALGGCTLGEMPGLWWCLRGVWSLPLLSFRVCWKMLITRCLNHSLLGNLCSANQILASCFWLPPVSCTPHQEQTHLHDNHGGFHAQSMYAMHIHFPTLQPIAHFSMHHKRQCFLQDNHIFWEFRI